MCCKSTPHITTCLKNRQLLGMKMMRAARLALGSPDDKTLLDPWFCRVLATNCCNAAVLWTAKPGAMFSGVCWGVQTRLVHHLSFSQSDSLAPSTKVQQSCLHILPGIHFCPWCIGVLQGSVLGASGVSAASGVFFLSCEGQALGLQCRTETLECRPHCRVKPPRSDWTQMSWGRGETLMWKENKSPTATLLLPLQCYEPLKPLSLLICSYSPQLSPALHLQVPDTTSRCPTGNQVGTALPEGCCRIVHFWLRG